MFFGAMGGAGITALVAIALIVRGGQSPAVATLSQAPAASAGQPAPASAIAAIYQKARPAVVEIDVQGGQGSGLGSGVIISDTGEILTNAHVVDGARRVQVKLSDGTTLPGTVKGVSAGDDLAIVQANVPKNKLAVINLGDSSKLQPGQQVVAIGNPFGLEGSVTQGIVSGIRSNQDSTGGPSNVIQIDAAINPGNSGGPLLDMNGNLVGINEALENPTGQDVFVGIGFAIPVDTAKADLTQLRSGGGSSASGIQGSGSGSGSPYGGSRGGGRSKGGSGSPSQGGQGNPFQSGPFGGGQGNPFQGGPFGGMSG